MPIAFVCDCGRRLRVADEKTGRKIRCPDCSAILVVPEVGHDQPVARRKTPRRQSGQAAADSRLPPSRSQKKSRTKKPTAKKKQFSPKERAVVLIAASIIFAIPAWLRSQRPNQTPSRETTTQPAAVGTKPAKLTPREEVLELQNSRYFEGPLDAEKSVRVLAIIDEGTFQEVQGELSKLAGKITKSNFRARGEFLQADMVGPELQTIAEGIQFGTVLKVDSTAKIIFVEGRKAHR